MLGFRRKRTNLHEKYDYPKMEEIFDAAYSELVHSMGAEEPA